MSETAPATISNTELVEFLSTTTADATFLQELKIRYRPYVCPFGELLKYAESDNVSSVYDIGCGSGQFAALVAKFTPAADIYGIEIDSHLVENAREINERFADKKLGFATFNGTEIPDNISEYDLVYMIDVYHHIPVSFRNDFMRQLYDKMKPGAHLMFKDIDGSSPFVACNKLHDLVFAQEFSHEIGFKKARSLLESIGFITLESYKKRVFVYPHYFILAQK